MKIVNNGRYAMELRATVSRLFLLSVNRVICRTYLVKTRTKPSSCIEVLNVNILELYIEMA